MPRRLHDLDDELVKYTHDSYTYDARFLTYVAYRKRVENEDIAKVLARLWPEKFAMYQGGDVFEIYRRVSEGDCDNREWRRRCTNLESPSCRKVFGFFLKVLKEVKGEETRMKEVAEEKGQEEAGRSNADEDSSLGSSHLRSE